MQELATKVDELIVVTPRVCIPKFLIRFKKSWNKWHLDPMTSKENGVEIIRPFVISLPGASFASINGILMEYSLLNLLTHLIKTRKIEIILGYNMLPEGIAAVRVAKRFQLPAGFWAIGSDVNNVATYNRVNYYLSRKCIEESHVVLTESKDLENRIRSFCNGPVHVHTFYKGIDLSNFQNLPPKNVLMKELNLNPERKYLLFVGRLTQDKGIYELVHAFGIIAKRYHDIDLLLIGEDIERNNLVVKLKEMGISNRVILTGIISQKEVGYYMKVSSLLVFPSWAEGLPNVVMEAMASGLPVIASDVGGIPEVLVDQVTGFSVPARNVEKLAETVIKMMEDKKSRERCIRNAEKLVSESFDVKKNVFKLLEILKDIKK
jgi:glycosyltransferase involved in cell wall biosynthesis